MKKRRQEAIIEIVAENPISTQEDLIGELSKRNIKTTQATLSRDIQELSLIKQRDERGLLIYTLPKASAEEKSLFEEAVLSVDYAMNMIVLKCRAGMAQGMCAAIDSVAHRDILGTIAGDDTIFILVRTEADAKNLSRKFKNDLLSGR